MSTETDGSHNGDRMEKIDVRVPADLLEQINKEYGRRGYASRSEAIRDALRDWLNPSVELSDDVLEDLATSREQRDRDETRSLESVMHKYGVDGDDSDPDK
ncbi:ribbon-helix-helix protein, CopG family [Haloterrigena sp. H1]|uniref:Ribbon-helix-helix domain-containing protein n=1 Tax=Haloarchaeobius amylolyticus TaxID=1198296 RepID=A0ABD6BDS0_9EURY|nr:ribbon-helix-helix domain-containing protein [Haloterrigena sp. H1]TMT86984.1 ribbon-helix-helix protein, CopG family [Haloterrigena sp. H1]